MLNCKFCNKEFKNKKEKHELRCPKNTNRLGKKGWSAEAKERWAKKCQETKCNNKTELSKEKRLALAERMSEFNKQYWNENTRNKHSLRMKQVVKENPDSYSSNNVSGRVKMYEINSSTGLTKVKGKWELAVAEWLNQNKIRWTNKIEPFPYYWNNSWHLYFPDFHLLDSDELIEVKGFETDRDRAKWSAVTKKLIIVNEEIINDLEQLRAGGLLTIRVS
jgi:hypothetical protein